MLLICFLHVRNWSVLLAEQPLFNGQWVNLQHAHAMCYYAIHLDQDRSCWPVSYFPCAQQVTEKQRGCLEWKYRLWCWRSSKGGKRPLRRTLLQWDLTENWAVQTTWLTDHSEFVPQSLREAALWGAGMLTAELFSPHQKLNESKNGGGAGGWGGLF